MSSLRTIKNQASWQTYNLDYAELLNALPAAVYVCDSEGFIRSYNEAAVKLWGRRPVIGKDLWCGSWKVYELDGTPLPTDKWPMTQTLKTGKPVGREMIIERPDLERFHVLAHPQPIFNERGELTGAVNMLVDVSQQVQFQVLEKRTSELSRTVEALKRSEELYHLMVAEVQDYAIILLSKDGIIQNWNKGAQKIKGYSEAEAVGKSFRIFYPPEDQASGLPDKLIGLARENGKANHEGWRVRKDGTRFWGSISITALHDSQGNVVGFSKVTRDLTERREAELRIQQYNDDLRSKNELLRQSEERYHRMISEVEDYVIILLDVDGYIQNWNKGAQKIKGYTADEILGKHFSIFYSPDDRRRGIPEKVLHEAASNGKALHEGWRLRKDGSAFWGSVVMTALHNDDDTLIGFTKVTRDLTDKKMTEETLKATSLKLEEKNKELERMNEELSSFAYISSHDLQEPLRKIQTFSDRILELEYNNLSDKGKDYFERMQRGAQRMQKLIHDILAYSRTTTSDKRLEETDLNEILKQSKNELEIQISEKNAVIESQPLPTLKVIPFQIQQLFNNLLSNALKFSKADVPPHIVVSSETVNADAVQGIYSPSATRYLHISIADNGIGFEPVYEKKIFEVFQRLHGRAEYGGTGIGLAICKKIVENHHGVLRAESIPNQGATFHIYLPFAA
ncbi:MAG TPA: PAS domain S-box protein [Chryseosolibacter sp.]